MLDENCKTSRRDFIKLTLGVSAVIPALALLNSCKKEEGSVETAAAPTAPEMPAGSTALEETDSVAQSLGYQKDASKVDTAKYPKKAGADGANQRCDTCQFYTTQNAGWGKCQLFPNGLVTATGWCNSWTQKA